MSKQGRSFKPFKSDLGWNNCYAFNQYGVMVLFCIQYYEVQVVAKKIPVWYWYFYFFIAQIERSRSVDILRHKKIEKVLSIDVGSGSTISRYLISIPNTRVVGKNISMTPKIHQQISKNIWLKASKQGRSFKPLKSVFVFFYCLFFALQKNA